MLRRTLALTATSALVAVAVLPATAAAGAAPARVAAAAAVTATAPLTNLAHLDFLTDAVDVARVPGHRTYHLGADPSIGVLWTYSERQPDGSYNRIGGGHYDAATDTYAQGAFNSDDIARAAVVYLRHWRQTGAASSRRTAYELLRGLAYFQTTRGPNAGNVVLWMQPDGSFEFDPVPQDSPNPSDSGPSYWMARAVWALGEGYAAFRHADPAFARFLQSRLELAVDALDRQVLDAYGQYQIVDGVRVPAWLIVDSAGATAEAVLGLSAYVAAGGDRGDGTVRRALRQFARGIAAMSAGDARHWPFGAVLPEALTRSVWHAWASQMPEALARASTTLGDRALLRPAVRDSATFVPWLLTSGGPDNGRTPTPTERAQIAYGVDSRVQSLLATADASGRAAFRRLAGVQAAWFFGANRAGVPAYDPATGVTFDGIEGDGRINPNSGAESTIHGLLTMLALDAHPGMARLARIASTPQRVGSEVVEAEGAQVFGAGRVVTPKDTWTGEARYGGTGYLALGNGARAVLTVPSSTQRRLVMPVIDLRPGSTAVTQWGAHGRRLGTVRSGAVGAQGTSAAPGALLPVTLPRWAPAGTTRLGVRATARNGDEALVDAVMLEPRVSSSVVAGSGAEAGHATAVLRTVARVAARSTVNVPGTGTATVDSYDASGRLVQRSTTAGSAVRVTVLPGGFTLVRR